MGTDERRTKNDHHINTPVDRRRGRSNAKKKFCERCCSLTEILNQRIDDATIGLIPARLDSSVRPIAVH
ncbi:hypothetical protein RE6C_04992 [Rhodopirellula europaea 6C]|uniref:Uncharacterized protein n=1 Tax=Rhodopirellula europaea 6C TaxID=1263867 RepID=M2ACG3_9BACT|nr:hypothetical protein RE6C_04992 [Rhodopirellula europaea 6C]